MRTAALAMSVTACAAVIASAAAGVKAASLTPFHYLFQAIDPSPHCLYRPTVIRSPGEEESIMRSAFRWSAAAAFAAAIVFGAPAHAFAQG